jgi:uncharacterized protein YbjT (DUF2867 family)
MPIFGGATQVLVTGAGGQTGTILVRKLLQQGKDKFAPRAMVRSEASEKKLRESLGDLADGLQFVTGDVTKPETLAAAFKGLHALVICTSSMPRIDYWSLPGVLIAKLVTLGFSSKRPSFYFDEDQSPEKIDWLGQQTQIDAAKAAGVKHIVLVSSMAGTAPTHFLNVALDNIVLWKRKAECYLMDSGIPYTILHPGGLLPHPGQEGIVVPGGKRELIADVDDALLNKPEQSCIPREDVAEVCLQCLLCPKDAKGRSFDLGSGPETNEAHTVNIKTLLAPLQGKNCAYTREDAIFQPNNAGVRGDSCGLCSSKM